MKRHPDANILRRNWLHSRTYLRYCREVRQVKDTSIAKVALNHLLEWATDIPFNRAPDIRPTFPAYLEEATSGKPAYRKKLLAYVRAFYTWAKSRWPGRYVGINHQWIETLLTRKQLGHIEEREVFDLDSVRTILTANPTVNRVDRRDRAAVAFLFLSGMRASAFCSLPVHAVDLALNPPVIKQWPDLGVRTKGGKAANTTLLPETELSDLWEIVRAWDDEVRAVGPDAMWFALLKRDGKTWRPDQCPGEHRDDALRKRLCALCTRADVPYLSPHKLRRGHIVWASERCENIADYKAVSQNVMHNSINLTDTVYNGMPDALAMQRVSALIEKGGGMTKEELIKKLIALLE